MYMHTTHVILLKAAIMSSHIEFDLKPITCMKCLHILCYYHSVSQSDNADTCAHAHTQKMV